MYVIKPHYQRGVYPKRRIQSAGPSSSADQEGNQHQNKNLSKSSTSNVGSKSVTRSTRIKSGNMSYQRNRKSPRNESMAILRAKSAGTRQPVEVPDVHVVDFSKLSIEPEYSPFQPSPIEHAIAARRVQSACMSRNEKKSNLKYQPETKTGKQLFVSFEDGTKPAKSTKNPKTKTEITNLFRNFEKRRTSNKNARPNSSSVSRPFVQTNKYYNHQVQPVNGGFDKLEITATPCVMITKGACKSAEGASDNNLPIRSTREMTSPRSIQEIEHISSRRRYSSPRNSVSIVNQLTLLE